ncbi:hypothetical protein [Oceanidesulfovibrio marinus]|uniref:hypothetical protein n=1 Tax=Oceanidesulfovibrio marinus TaxID=370038 RepID=UPI00118560FB|nr:hypothetical protein [Oceanidesulfovibrio marinus]
MDEDPGDIHNFQTPREKAPEEDRNLEEKEMKKITLRKRGISVFAPGSRPSSPKSKTTHPKDRTWTKAYKANRNRLFKLESLGVAAKGMATFTYDSRINRNMRITKDRVTEEQWSSYKSHVNSLLDGLTLMFPDGWFFAVAEIGEQCGFIHTHMLFDPQNNYSKMKVTNMLFNLWSNIIGSDRSNICMVKSVNDMRGAISYLSSTKKLRHSLPLFRSSSHGRRHTKFLRNKAAMAFIAPQEYEVDENTLMRIRKALARDYRKHCEEQGTPVNPHRIRALKENNGFHHFFNNNRQLSIIKQELERSGPVGGKKRSRTKGLSVSGLRKRTR